VIAAAILCVSGALLGCVYFAFRRSRMQIERDHAKRLLELEQENAAFWEAQAKRWEEIIITNSRVWLTGGIFGANASTFKEPN
jgi:cbb3-type cytochrome oxidase subunit 3